MATNALGSPARSWRHVMPYALDLWLTPVAALVLFASSTLLGDLLLGAARLRASSLLLRLACGAGVGILCTLCAATVLLATGWSSTFAVAIAILGASRFVVRRTPHSMRRRQWFSTVFAAAAAAAAYALWLAWWHTDGNPFVVRAPLQRDTLHYVVLSAFLDRTGVETPQPHFLTGVSAVRAPYHYLDAWLAVVASRTFGVGHLLGYMAVAQSLLATTLALALGALVRRVTGLSSLPSVACAVVASLPGIEPAAEALTRLLHGTALDRLFGGLELYVMPPLFVNKVLPAALLVVFTMLAGAHRRTRAAAPWLLASLPLAYFPYAPFAFSALGAVVAMALWKRAGGMARSGALALGAGLLLLLPEFGNPLRSDFFFLEAASGARPALSEVLAGAARVVAGGTSRVMALLVVPLVVGGAVWARRKRRLWLGLLLAPMLVGLEAGVFAWGATHRTIDSWQLLTTVSSVVFSVLYALTAGVLLRRLLLPPGHAGLVRQVLLCSGLAACSILWANTQFGVLAEQADGQSSKAFRAAARAAAISSGRTKGIGVWIRGVESFKELWDFNLGSSTHPLAFLLSDEPYTLVLPVQPLALAEGMVGERQLAMLKRSPVYRGSGFLPSDPDWVARSEQLLAAQEVQYVLLDPGVEPDWLLAGHLHGCVRDELSGLRYCSWE